MVLFQIFYFISNNKLYRPAGDSNSIAKKKLNKLSDLQLIVRVYDIESTARSILLSTPATVLHLNILEMFLAFS